MKDEQVSQNPSGTCEPPPLSKMPSPVTPSCDDKQRIDDKLDEAIMETFPASDPISISVPSCSHPSAHSN